MNEEWSQFSKEMSQRILEAFPEWRSNAVSDENCGEKYFKLTIDPPSNNTGAPLEIDTYQEEITVAFDAYHSHFSSFEGDEWENAYTFIKNIISDKYAVVSYWRNEQWCGSWFQKKKSFPNCNEEYPYANKIKIRSWSRELDADIECKPKD
ncbi:MAG: hypothetical protein JAZ15_21705 [Candidatus Thiodiazotropha endolucinida]|nr:hypothetical protein [Candidatus Thiodiazotropha taylori]MCW4315633.1 hypothetical protein [Candidatus Thiodiazotropha taylori]